MNYPQSNKKNTKFIIRQTRAKKLLQTLAKMYPSDPKTVLHYSNPWELVVSVQLSAQCTDKKVNEITPTLFKKYPTLDDYVHAKPSEFANDIRQSGYYNNKTKNILSAAKMLKEHFGGTVPRTMAEISFRVLRAKLLTSYWEMPMECMKVLPLILMYIDL